MLSSAVHVQELSALEQTLRQSTTTEALAELEEELLSQTMDFHSVQIDPAPFQLVGRTSLYKACCISLTLCKFMCGAVPNCRFTVCSPF